MLGAAGLAVAGAAPEVAFGVAGAIALPVGALGCCAAAFSTMKGPDLGDANAILQPEMANMRTAFRLGFPLVLCTIAYLPVLAARHAPAGRSPAGAALAAGFVPLVAVAVVTLGWVRFREDLAGVLDQAAAGGGTVPPTGDR